MTLDERIKQCTTLEELGVLQLEMLGQARAEIEKNPLCVNEAGWTPIQTVFFRRRQELLARKEQ